MPVENDFCPLCGTAGLGVVLELPGVPVQCNQLWTDRGAARSAPTGDLRLAFCRACTYVFNDRFRPEQMAYGEGYDNSLHFSLHFRDYSRSLAGYLVERFGLRNRCVLEIGCGKGEFLAQLIALGANRGIGFDPSFQPGRIPEETAARMHVVRDLFSPGQTGVEADFICCRHVLEHQPDPVSFLRRLRPPAGGRSVPVFFEVPNLLFTLRDHGIWDLIYEHPSYFTPPSLGRAFAAAGFEVLGVRETFSGQYLCLEAITLPERPARPAPAAGEVQEIGALVERFGERFTTQVDAWREALVHLRRLGRRAVIWGAGSKGVTFLSLLQPGEEIAGVVDLNPYKQGKFVPGTGLPVLAPEALPALAPDLVIVMNPAYRREIENYLERLGVWPEVKTA